MKIYDMFDESWINANPNLIDKAKDAIRNSVLATEDIDDYIPDLTGNLLFQVFRNVKLKDVSVVILGMDPYHDGSYIGRAFGNSKDKEHISPSLRNILKEIDREYGKIPDQTLEGWEKQGVLLLNVAHSVERNSPGSHLEYWEEFTSEVLNTIAEANGEKVLYMAWGNNAKNAFKDYCKKCGSPLFAGHPSPLNRSNPFVGSNIFKHADYALKFMGKKIDWTL